VWFHETGVLCYYTVLRLPMEISSVIVGIAIESCEPCFTLYWCHVVAMEIPLSTRRTAGSHIWFTCLADKLMVRSYRSREHAWIKMNIMNKINKKDNNSSPLFKQSAPLWTLQTYHLSANFHSIRNSSPVFSHLLRVYANWQARHYDCIAQQRHLYAWHAYINLY